jgi:hypothetical protein
MRSGYLREQLRGLPVAVAFIAVAVGFLLVPHVTAAAIAAILFLIAAAIVVEDRLLARHGRRTQGMVVGFEEEEDCFIPVVEYKDAKGETKRKTTRTGRGVQSPPVGSRVVIVFDPTGKYGCEIDSFWRRWGFALMVALIGAAFVVGAIWGR